VLPSACAERASGTSGPCFAYVRCCALTSCRVWLPTGCHRRGRKFQQRQQALFLFRAMRSPAISPEVGDWRVDTCLPARPRRVPGRDPAAPGRFADVGSCCGLPECCERVFRRALQSPCCHQRMRDGPDGPVGPVAPTSEATPCHRTGGEHLQCCHQRVEKCASGTSRSYVSCERCRAMSSCRLR